MAPTNMLGETPPVAAASRRTGTLRASAIPGSPDDDQQHWLQGVVAWPESLAGWRLVQDCSDAEADYGHDLGNAPVGAMPVMVQTLLRCPRRPLPEMAASAARRLEAITSQAAARELWTGDLTRTDPWAVPDGVPFELSNPSPAAGTFTNPYLTAASLLSEGGTAVTLSPAGALAAVEAAVSDVLGGGPVYLHVPLDVLFELAIGLRPEGNLLYTPAGSVVIADGGYPGEPAAGTGLAIYGTGPVQTWVGPMTVYDRPEQVVSVSTNEIGIWAERPVMSLFDPQTLVGCTVTPE